MIKVLIIEDDKNLADVVEAILVNYDFSVDKASDGKVGLEKGLTNTYDVIILDLMLPGIDGLQVCSQLKAENISASIIMVTAKSEIQDRLNGFEAGADDYLPKPFSPKELVARIKALTRRTTPVASMSNRFSDLEFDPEIGEISCRDVKMNLSDTESALLQVLLKKPGKVCTKEEIIQEVWANSENINENNVEAYVSFLRKKMKFIGTHVEIVTLRKKGYKLEP